MLQTITSSESYIILAVFAVLALVALIYLLSPPSPMSLLDDIIARGAQIRERLRQLVLRQEYPSDTKSLLLAAYVDIALEHHEAIWLLTERKLNGSALAMVRPVFDTMYRALWINRVATDQQIERAIDDKVGFDIDKILDQIKEGYFSGRPADEVELFSNILQVLREAWGPMCSFAHSGALPIRRRFTGNELKPNYDDAAVVEALNLVTLALLLLLHMFFVSMNCQKEDEETQRLVRQYSVDFADRLHDRR